MEAPTASPSLASRLSTTVSGEASLKDQQAYKCSMGVFKNTVLIRLNMAPFGVKVICIEPGYFKTNMCDPELLNNNFKLLWEKLPQEVKDQYGPDYLPKCEFG